MLSKSDRVLLFAFVCLNAILIAGSLSAVEKKKVLSDEEIFPAEARFMMYLNCSRDTQLPEYCQCSVDKLALALKEINVSIFDFSKLSEKSRDHIIDNKVVKECLQHLLKARESHKL